LAAARSGHLVSTTWILGPLSRFRNRSTEHRSKVTAKGIDVGIAV
jgi:hypothetical protein